MFSNFVFPNHLFTFRKWENLKLLLLLHQGAVLNFFPRNFSAFIIQVLQKDEVPVPRESNINALLNMWTREKAGKTVCPVPVTGLSGILKPPEGDWLVVRCWEVAGGHIRD